MFYFTAISSKEVVFILREILESCTLIVLKILCLTQILEFSQQYHLSIGFICIEFKADIGISFPRFIISGSI